MVACDLKSNYYDNNGAVYIAPYKRTEIMWK